MNREEFNAKVTEKFDEFRNSFFNTEKENIFDNAYKIAKMSAIVNYLCESDEDMSELYPYADRILDMLYDWENTYDLPKWLTWDDMDEMIYDFTVEH